MAPHKHKAIKINRTTEPEGRRSRSTTRISYFLLMILFAMIADNAPMRTAALLQHAGLDRQAAHYTLNIRPQYYNYKRAVRTVPPARAPAPAPVGFKVGNAECQLN
jgi:hypothetical protein